MTKQLGLICLSLGLLFIFAGTSDAQYGLIQRSNRALGHWNGPGYHRCNPGPNVSYYNTWTQKNSFLISKSPQFLSRYGHELNPTPMGLLYSGQSAHGQPPMMANPGYHGATMNADFVPAQRDSRDDEDEDDDESDFEADDDSDDFQADEDLEDRFDEEVDRMDDSDAGFSDPGELDADTEAQDSPSDEAAEATSALLNPGSLFLPASHGG